MSGKLITVTVMMLNKSVENLPTSVRFSLRYGHKQMSKWREADEIFSRPIYHLITSGTPFLHAHSYT